MTTTKKGHVALAAAVTPRMKFADLVRETGIKRHRLRSIVSRAVDPTAAEALAIARVLGISVEEWAQEAVDAPSAPVLDEGEDESE